MTIKGVRPFGQHEYALRPQRPASTGPRIWRLFIPCFQIGIGISESVRLWPMPTWSFFNVCILLISTLVMAWGVHGILLEAKRP